MPVPGAVGPPAGRVAFDDAHPAAASAQTTRPSPTTRWYRHSAYTTVPPWGLGATSYRAAVVRPAGAVSPTNFNDSRPRITLGVTIHDPPQAAIATLPAVGGEAIAVTPLPMPPRMQNVALSGA